MRYQKFKNELSNSGKIVFMPGSRKTEIKNLMPIFKDLIKKIPNKDYILVIPSKFSDEYIKKVYGDIGDFKISKNAHEALLEAEYAFYLLWNCNFRSCTYRNSFYFIYIAKKLDFFYWKNFCKIKLCRACKYLFWKNDK